MSNKRCTVYYLLACAGVLALSAYPLYMGIRVVADMVRFGTVYAENYPKYIIPYTPISLAVILGVALMPLLMKKAGKWALPAGAALSLGAFFGTELLLESQVIVTETVTTTLESWQMYMCYVPPEGYITRTWTAVDVLIGEYSPAFKIHFYLISAVLILSVLNCLYGFARVVRQGDRSRMAALVTQSVCSGLFLVMCIWACFTAFYRTGELQVSALSAVLMTVFFVLLGVTVGVYIGSFLQRGKGWLPILLPSAIASAVTLIMYIGEMILLDGHLYRFGTGFLFDGLGRLVLSPADILIILLAGAVTGGILYGIRHLQKKLQFRWGMGIREP